MVLDGKHVDSRFSSKGLQAAGMAWKAINSTGKDWGMIATGCKYY
jgi:hypothetical protein